MKEKLYKQINGNDTYYFKDPEMTILHRTDGPAIISTGKDPVEEWYQNDRLHRLDGPAIVTPDTDGKFYYVDEVEITRIYHSGKYAGSYILQQALDRKKREG